MFSILSLIYESLSIIGALKTAQDIFVWLFGPRVIPDCHTRDKVIEDPGLVMGDRALESVGFSEQYLNRPELDGALEDFFRDTNPKTRKQNIVLITGRHASGKSRIIWEFIRSDVGKQFKTIYIPRIANENDSPMKRKSVEKVDLKQEIARLPKSTLVVFDDIDTLLDIKYRNLTLESLQEILAMINGRNMACLITMSKSVLHFDQYKGLISGDNSLGQNKRKKVKILEIPDIEYGDETHLWCTANLPVKRYAKVIGGYIRLLNRYADVNVHRIVSEPSAVLYLVSFIIMKKYRNRFRVLSSRISRLYQVIREKDGLDNLPAVPDEQRISILFSSGMLLKSGRNRNEIEVDDEFLFDSFGSYCTDGGKGNDTSDVIIRTYMGDSQTAEWAQVVRLLEMEGGNDPVIYARVIARTRYPEMRTAVTNWFIKKFFNFTSYEDSEDLVPNQLKPEYASSPNLPEIVRAASLIVGRDQDPIGRCEDFMDAGLEPDIITVNELFRASMNHMTAQGRNEIRAYALDLKQQYELEDDLYFCQVMEVTDPGFDEERLIRAEEIYWKEYDFYSDPSTKDEEQLENLYNSMDAYCARLAMKAVSEQLVNEYFDLLQRHSASGIYLKKGAVRKLIYNISDKAGAMKASVFLLLARKLVEASRNCVREEVCHTGLLNIIEKSPDAKLCLDIYEAVAPSIEATLNPAFTKEFKSKEKFLNLMAMHMAYKMKHLSLDSIEYTRIQEVMKDRILAACQNGDAGAAQKLYNASLNNQPLRPLDKALDHLVAMFKDEGWLAVRRDIHNLNSAFQNAIEPYKEESLRRLKRQGLNEKDLCDRLSHVARLFDGLRKEEGIPADDRFKVLMFGVILQIKYLDPKFQTEDIRNRIEFDSSVERVSGESLKKHERLWCQALRLADTPELPTKIAQECLHLAGKGEYLMDTINHLMSFWEQSKEKGRLKDDNQLKEVLIELEGKTFHTIPHTIHDYCHYLSFDIETGVLENERDVEAFIDDAWTRLQYLDLSLREPKADLLCTAINIKRFNLQQAIDIVNYGIEYNRTSRYRPTPILTQDVIFELVKKFRWEETALNDDRSRWSANKNTLYDYATQIQNIIYTMDWIVYPDKDTVFNRVKNPIDGPLRAKYGRKTATLIPIESGDDHIRRTVLKKRVDESGVLRCNTYEVMSFLYGELFKVNRCIIDDCRRPNSRVSEVSDYIEYILFVLESAKAEEIKKNIATLNTERYLDVFETKPECPKYNNFFEGYLLGGYVPDNLVDRWKAAAVFYQFHIKES